MVVFEIINAAISVGLAVQGTLPKQNEDQTIVRIGAGLSVNRSDSPGGHKPGVHLYDTMGRSIGSTSGSTRTSIRDGSFMDISVPFDEGIGNEPTEYISVTNGGDDALCIAYITLTQPNGDQKAWYGDIAKRCGADWYHSQLKTGDDDYQPACIWIDRNRSNGFRFQGLGMHINDFAATQGRADQYNDNIDLMCKAAPRLRMYEIMSDGDPIPFFDPPLEYNSSIDKDPALVLDKTHWALPVDGPNINKTVVDADPAPPQRLVRKQIPTSLGNKLIVSQSTHHSAKELCESVGSVGPDFVSLEEQLFCDMASKRTWQLCGANKTSGCFDLTSTTVKTGNETSDHFMEMFVKVESALIKAYEKKIHWT